LTVEYLAIIQAVDYLSLENNLSSETKNIYNELRTMIPVFTEDAPRYPDLEKIKDFLKETTPNIFD